MKVLIISPYPTFGGALTANQNIARMLAMAGNDVYMADEFGNITREEDSFKVVDLPVYSWRLTGKHKILRHILDEGYDYVLFGMPHMTVFYLWVTLYLKFFSKVRTGTIFHSLCLGTGLKDRVYERLIAFATLAADQLIYVSDYTRRSWEKFLSVRMSPARIFIRHNAVPQLDVAHTEPEGKPRISLVGRLSGEKRPEAFCRIAEQLSDSFDFFVWGNGPLEEQLKEKYSEHVNFMGYVSDMGHVYSHTDILMMTSEFENCPMVILEARTLGVPALTVNVGGISEIVREGYNGRFFDLEEEPQTIKEKLMDILGNKEDYRRNCLDSALTLQNYAVSWNELMNAE